MADIGNVQTARGDIGGDQHREFAFVKLAQESQPLGLRHIARDGLGAEAIDAQHGFEPLGRALGVDEHHGAMGFELAQQRDQQRHLLRHRGEIYRLAHAIDGHFVRLDAHQLGVVHVLVGEFQHALRERGREQHRLAVLGRRQAAQDVADVGDETQIKHAIGFIEHHDLRMTQVIYALFEIIDDATGRADQHIDAIGKLAALLVVVDPAEHHGEWQAGVAAEHGRVLVYLHREFARGCHHQRAHRSGRATGVGGLGQQRLIQRHQKGGSLAGAGLGLSGDITTGERRGQGLRLDRRAATEAGLGDALHKRRMQRQAAECQ